MISRSVFYEKCYRRVEGCAVREATWERSQDNVEGAKGKGRQHKIVERLIRILGAQSTNSFANYFEQLAGPGEAGKEEDGEEGEVGGVEGEDHQDDRVRPPAERVPSSEGIHSLPPVHSSGGILIENKTGLFFNVAIFCRDCQTLTMSPGTRAKLTSSSSFFKRWAGQVLQAFKLRQIPNSFSLAPE